MNSEPDQLPSHYDCFHDHGMLETVREETVTDQPLTPEREQEIREWAYNDETSMVAAEQRELFAEIDRLREALTVAMDALGYYADGIVARHVAREALHRIGEQ